MGGGNYLIPANSKKSKLILGVFNYVDMFIFGTGLLITLALLFIVKSNNLGITLLKITPLLIGSFLVMPVPNYHNMFTLLNNINQYFHKPREYYWKGWCYKDGSKH